MQLQDLTFDKFIGAVVLVLLLVDIYVKLMSAAKTRREEQERKNKPVNNLEETVKDHTTKLGRDHERLNELEESNRIIMRALMAMLSHEINGNSDDKLCASFDEIQKFLIEK